MEEDIENYSPPVMFRGTQYKTRWKIVKTTF